LALVPRLFDPDSPSNSEHGVFIDGVDIRTVSVRSLRRQIGVVTQETVLFRGTSAGTSRTAPRTRRRSGSRPRPGMARAHEFIGAMPQGYDTAVGDQGLTLSGGQRSGSRSRGGSCASRRS